MRHRLVNESSAAICLLFDRALAVETDLGSFDAFVDWFDAQAKRGGVFRYDMGGRGECGVDCYVDEDPPKDLCDRSSRVTDELLLRVPTGQLCFAGAETVPDGDEQSWACVDITPGDYAVRAWLLEPQDDEVDGAPHHRGSVAGCVGILLAFLLFVIVGFVGLRLQSLAFAAVVVGAVVVLVIGSLLWYNFSGKRDQEQRESDRQLQEGPPDVVLGMHLVPNAEGMVGGGISV